MILKCVWVSGFILFAGCTHTKIKRISIVSEPSGADVTMNGEYVGKAPVSKEIKCICTNWCDEGHDWTWKPGNIHFIAMPNTVTGGGESQSTLISPCLDDENSKTIFFNMKLKTLPQKNQVDLNIQK